MSAWVLLFNTMPYEPGDYLVFGIAGKHMQWIDHWDGERFDKFPKRKIIQWMKIPLDGWQIYPEWKPEKDGRYLVFLVRERDRRYKIMHFNYQRDGSAKFVQEDSFVAAFHSQPADPEY